MKVRISIDKVEALKAGRDRHGLAVVEVPAESLTPEQREELAQYHYPRYGSSSNDVDFYLDGRDYAAKVAEATPDTVRVILDALRSHRLAEEEEKKAKHEKDVQACLEAPIEEWIVTHSNGSQVDTWVGSTKRPDDERLAGKLAEAQDLADKLNAEKKTRDDAERLERERKVAEEKAKKDAGREALKQWALAAGSEWLKARIEEGFEWEGMAEQEFGQQTVDGLALDLEDASSGPEGYESGSPSERTTPTLEEIQALRTARQRAEGKPVSVALKWVKYEPQEEEEDFDYPSEKPEPIQRTELEIVVTCPNGAQRYFYFLPMSPASV